MATVDKLSLLMQTKADIKAAIEAKGQEVGLIPFSQYASKIAAIETGGSSGTSQFYLNKCTLTIDDGYHVERIPISAGDVIDLGEGADVEASTNWGSYYHAKSHPHMTFQQWSSSIAISDNQFVVPDDICTDYTVGAIYSPTDGKTWVISMQQGGGYLASTPYEGSTEYATFADDDAVALWEGGGSDQASKICIFLGCRKLELISISIEHNVSNSSVFMYNCPRVEFLIMPNLESMTIPPYENGIAMSCDSLRYIVPSQKTTINYASGCPRVEYLPTRDTPSVIGPMIYGSTPAGFYGCSSLKVLEFEDISLLSTDAFYGCYALGAVILKQTTPPTLYPLEDLSSYYITFLVPASAISAYKAATNWVSIEDRIIEDTEENRKLFGIW